RENVDPRWVCSFDGVTAADARRDDSKEIPMSQYLLTLHTSPAEQSPQMTPEERERSWSDILAVNEALKASGAWVYGGRLDEPAAAKVVRPRNSKIRVTDGPFMEAKEQI